MRTTFIQGIVSTQSGFITFNGTGADLNTNNAPTIFTAANGTTNGITNNYLYEETHTVTSAWTGPFTTSTNGVTAIASVLAGSHYSSAPSVTFTGGNGYGATATATLSAVVSAISLVAAGTGYTGTPTVAITGGGGSGATATATAISGAITQITITNAGTGYTSVPTVTISGTGTGAVATASILGTVASYTVTNHGQGYTVAPTINVSGGGGSGATATATISGVTATSYLYWDIDVTSGIRTFGVTGLTPVYAASPPANPVTGLHWFDTVNRYMNYWNGFSWVICIRVFAASVASNTITAQTVGSQVGINEAGSSGFILFDDQNKAVKQFNRSGLGKFITSETALSSQRSGVVNTKQEAAIVTGVATGSIPAFSPVYLSGTNAITLATSNIQSPTIGIVEAALSVGQLGLIIDKGYVANLSWNWSAPAGSPVFVSSSGTLTTTPPNVNTIQQIATVLSPTELYLSVGPMVYIQGTGNLVPAFYDLNTGRFPVTGSSGTISLRLEQLADVDITSPTNGQVLTYVSGTWINVTSGAAPVTSVNSLTGAVVLGLGTLNNVVLTSPVIDQFLGWNGTDWVNTNTLKNYNEIVNAQGSQSTTVAIDFTTGNVQTVTLTGNVTLTLSNPAASGLSSAMTIVITQDSTGTRTITWPGSVKWQAGAAPTLSTAAAAVDVVTLFTVNGGTTYYGTLAIANAS